MMEVEKSTFQFERGIPSNAVSSLINPEFPIFFMNLFRFKIIHYMVANILWAFFTNLAISWFKNNIKLGEFTMVSQPIRLILVDCFVFHFC